MISIEQIRPELTYRLRHEVLWPDQPLAFVKLENDADGWHFGAFEEGRLVGVISLFLDENANQKTARFRKFAVSPACQRRGIGTDLLTFVLAEAQRLGAQRIWCDARLDAGDFYRRFGMEAVGPTFYKGTIPYARFEKKFDTQTA